MRRISGSHGSTTLLAIATLVLGFGWAAPASAQFPADWSTENGSPEGGTLPSEAGETISNTATIDYEDANGYEYTGSATVDVIVELVPNIRVEYLGAADPPVTPGGEYTYYFQITNLTNDQDHATVTLGLDLDYLTVVSLCYKVMDRDGDQKQDGDPPSAVEECFDNIADFEAALAAIELDIHEFIVVGITVEVKEGVSGPTTITVDAESEYPDGEDGSDEVTLSIGDVTVAPPADVDRLPSYDITEYSAQFTINNDQVGAVTYELSYEFLSTNDAGLSFVRLEVCGGAEILLVDGKYTYEVAANSSADICVIYYVGDFEGESTVIKLTADDGTYSASGETTVTVIKPVLTITKKAYRDNAGAITTTEIVNLTGEVAPGEYFWYEITVENDGSAVASAVAVEDDLDLAFLTWQSTILDELTPTWATVGTNTGLGQIRGQLTAITPTDAVRTIRIRVLLK